MNKKFFLLSSVALMLFAANAQSKLTLSTRLLMEGKEQGTPMMRKTQAPKSDRIVMTSILLEKGANVTDEQLAELNIKVAKRLNGLLLAYVPVSQLANLAEIEGVRLIDAGSKQRLTNDRSREASSVPMVHDMNVVNSNADMPEYYRGKDVLVGIIDTGIDLGHPAFHDANGKSRIKQAVLLGLVRDEEAEIVDIQATTYNEDQIDQAIEDTKDMPARGGGHGTHVAGIAVGSTVALPDGDPMKPFYGMAPEADILTYELESGYNPMMLYSLADAFDKADQWQRPVVMNMSWGHNSARVDGTDGFSLSLGELVSSYDMKGKVICISSGNEGDETLSVQMDCNKPIENNDWTAQHLFLCVLQNAEVESGVFANDAIFDFYGADNRDYAVKFDLYNYKTSDLVASSPLFMTQNCLEGELHEQFEESYYLGAYGQSEVSLANRMYMENEFRFQSPVKVFVAVTVYTKEEGLQIDGAALSGCRMVESVSNTVQPNNWGSINPLVCNDYCIGVGSYNTRSEFVDQDGYLWKMNDEGDISSFSSYRHPHYGGMAPTVAAPGAFILSSYNHNVDRELEPVMGTTLYNGVEHLWGMMQGTSMAAPAATGIIALWLQANPNLTREDIIEILANTCDYDDFCQDSPYRFGLGKINAKRGIDYILNQTVALTNVSNSNAGLQPAKFIDAEGRIMIRKGDRQYDVMGVEREK